VSDDRGVSLEEESEGADVDKSLEDCIEIASVALTNQLD